MSNADYDPKLGADLYNRYLDEKLYAEEMGFDGLMLNEHHSTPFCMGSVMNVEAAILARITKRAKIVLLGNVLPIWDDPLWLAEELAEIDMISRGRLVTGWVRGTGRESVAHNAQSPYNWERFQEAHDFIVKAWTTPGPWRWEGEHYQFRYVNPWARPYQDPHPPIWIPGILSRNTVDWAAKHRYPYIMLATDLEPTKKSFEYYDEQARERGYEAGTQHHGYLFKVHVDETDELADEVGRKYVQGPSNPFLEGNQGTVLSNLQNLPGLTSRTQVLPTILQLRRPPVPRPGRRPRQAGRRDRHAVGTGQGERRRPVRGLPVAEGALHDHHRHAQDRDPQGAACAGDAAAGVDLLLGWRRRDDPRRLHAIAAADGRGSHPRGARDRQGVGPAGPVRDGPADAAARRCGRRRLAPSAPTPLFPAPPCPATPGT